LRAIQKNLINVEFYKRSDAKKIKNKYGEILYNYVLSKTEQCISQYLDDSIKIELYGNEVEEVKRLTLYNECSFSKGDYAKIDNVWYIIENIKPLNLYTLIDVSRVREPSKSID